MRVVAPGPEGARAIIDAERYMTLATAGADGVPWANPVWYAPDGPSELLWVSNPDARHSRNLAERPELGIVIFDSTVTPGDGQAVYMEATATQVEVGLDVFSARSVAQGMPAWDALPDHLRLYRAIVSQHWMLGEGRDERVPVSP